MCQSAHKQISIFTKKKKKQFENWMWNSRILGFFNILLRTKLNSKKDDLKSIPEIPT